MRGEYRSSGAVGGLKATTPCSSSLPSSLLLSQALCSSLYSAILHSPKLLNTQKKREEKKVRVRERACVREGEEKKKKRKKVKLLTAKKVIQKAQLGQNRTVGTENFSRLWQKGMCDAGCSCQGVKPFWKQ